VSARRARRPLARPCFVVGARGPAHDQGLTKCVFLARAPHGGRTDGPTARAVTADSSSPRRGGADQQGAAAP